MANGKPGDLKSPVPQGAWGFESLTLRNSLGGGLPPPLPTTQAGMRRKRAHPAFLTKLRTPLRFGVCLPPLSGVNSFGEERRGNGAPPKP